MKSKLFRVISKIITIIIGIYSVYIATLHGYYEILNKNIIPNGILFDAISGNSLATNYPGWPGWPAMTIIPNFLITGIIVYVIAGIMLLWLLILFNNRKWEQILVFLAILLCLFGGGIKWPLFVIVSGSIGIILDRINHKNNL
jgi:hypothetical protein